LTLKIKKTLKIIIPLLFGGGLVWYLFTIIPPKTLLEYFKNEIIGGLHLVYFLVF